MARIEVTLKCTQYSAQRLVEGWQVSEANGKWGVDWMDRLAVVTSEYGNEQNVGLLLVIVGSTMATAQ